MKLSQDSNTHHWAAPSITLKVPSPQGVLLYEIIYEYHKFNFEKGN